MPCQPPMLRAFIACVAAAALFGCCLFQFWSTSKFSPSFELRDWAPATYFELREAVAARPMFGFVMVTFNKVGAELLVLRRARQIFPDSPIVVMQDGGSSNLTRICALPQYRCTFEWFPDHASFHNPHPWLARFRWAIQQLGTEYIVLLEPDVKVRGRPIRMPTGDAGGVRDWFNPEMKLEAIAYAEHLGRERRPCFSMVWARNSLCGGSYFRAAAMLDATRPEHIARIDWGALLEQDPIYFNSDRAMLLALSARGWYVYPWEETSENNPDGNDYHIRPDLFPNAAFVHDIKDQYQEEIPADERALVDVAMRTSPAISCAACIWYPDYPSPDNITATPPIPRNSAHIYDAAAMRARGRPPICD